MILYEPNHMDHMIWLIYHNKVEKAFLSGALTSISLGFLKEKIDRIYIITTGFILQTIVLALMLAGVIYPNPQHIGTGCKYPSITKKS